MKRTTNNLAPARKDLAARPMLPVSQPGGGDFNEGNMKTVMSKEINSSGIRKHFGENTELEILGTIGSGDDKMTLYRSCTGQEVIETNGDPCWDSEHGFQEVREQIMGVE